MYRKILLCLCWILLSAAVAAAQSAEEKTDGKMGPEAEALSKAAETKEISKAPETEELPKAPETKELSGMSIVGNDEAPKSLYIVPWKSSEVGVETSLSMMLNEDDVPVDVDVFSRQIEFYYVSVGE